MNGSMIMVGAMAAASIAFIGFMAYSLDLLNTNIPDSLMTEDDSSLEEDLRDILGFIPLKDVQKIIENYMKYDAQIADTTNFINDQKRFVIREFRMMPEVIRMIDFLRANGLDVDYWAVKIQILWKTSPRYLRSDPSIASGGFTVMINKILRTIPQGELRELLRQKVKYSGSFRRFLQVLQSKDFSDLCEAIERNDVLNQNFFWAKESGLEITFALELFKNFYIYLTEELH